MTSGVFVRRGPDGNLIMLDQRGRSRSALGPGAGLVAATAGPGGELNWIVTGSDSIGLGHAVGALNARSLTDHLAVAIAADGRVLNLPRVSP
jgi:hypothetical protein